MQPLATDLNLPFQTGKVILIEPKEFGFTTQHHEAFHRLGKQKLMVERHVRTTVFQGKNYPDSHSLFVRGKKIACLTNPALKII